MLKFPSLHTCSKMFMLPQSFIQLTSYTIFAEEGFTGRGCAIEAHILGYGFKIPVMEYMCEKCAWRKRLRP